MATLPLSQTVEAALSRRSWRSSIFSLLTSTAVQCLAITILVVTPLLVAQTLPEPISQLSLPDFVSVDIEPPASPGPERRSDAKPPPETGWSPAIPSDWLELPPDIPEGILDSDVYFSSEDSVDVPGGMPPHLGGTSSIRARPSEPTADEDPEPIRITGDIQPPRKIVHVKPVYPTMARMARIQGTVRLQAVIDIDGRVSNLTVVESVTLLDQAAIEAVAQWRYEPTRLGGRAVPVIMTVEVTFELH